MKRILSVILTLIMVLGLGSAALAFPGTQTGNKLGATITVVAIPEVSFAFDGLDNLVGGVAGKFSMTAKVADNDAIRGTTPLRVRLTLTTNSGAPVVGKTLSYKYEGIDYTSTTDSNGVIWFGADTGFTLEQISGLLTESGVKVEYGVTMAEGSYKLDVAMIDITNGGEVVLDEVVTETFTVAPAPAAKIVLSWADPVPSNGTRQITATAGSSFKLGVRLQNTGTAALARGLAIMTVKKGTTLVTEGITATCEGVSIGKGEDYFYWGEVTGTEIKVGDEWIQVFDVTFANAGIYNVEIFVVQLPGTVN